jgi:hypothetical protein
LTQGAVTITEQHIQNSEYVYNMAEATVTTESGYLKMFAAFFVGASEAESHYYSTKPLHKDIPDLARLIGVAQDNFQALLECPVVLVAFGRMANSSSKRTNLTAS